MEIETSTKSKTEAFEPVRLKEGIYDASLKEVKDISEGQYGPRVAFIYEINGKDLALVAYKTKATKDNKIGKTLMAHGVEINDEKVNTENLPKTTVRAWVEDFEKEVDEDGKKEKVIQSTISKVKPLAKEEKPSN